MLKQDLRVLYKKERKNLQDREALSQQIAHRFFEYFPWESYDNFHIFLPMSKMNEVETSFIYQKLWQAQKKVFSPVVVGPIMLSVSFEPNSLCQTSHWGIPEPIGEEQSPDFSVVFMPLLCADAKGNRLGYGKGFYDEFLMNLSPKTLKIGLNFFPSMPQMIDDLRPEDIPLDYLVSPTAVESFGAKSMK